MANLVFGWYPPDQETVPIQVDENGVVQTSASGGGGGAVTIADGADVTVGAKADAAVGDGTGTVNAHLRQIAKVLSDVWASGSHWLQVSIQNATLAITNPLAGPFTGQAKIATTGTAVQLGAHTLSNGVIVTANGTNAAAITVGGSSVTNTVDGTGNGYILVAGASISFAAGNSNAVYVNGTSGDFVSFAGS